MPTRKTRRRSAALAALGLAVAAGVAVLGPSGASASSHREAPLIAADPAVDNTDVYGFVSPDRPGYVTLLADFIPFEEPNGGPNFYPFATDAVYNIKIDNNGDARPDVVYRWKFHNVDKRGGNTFLYNNGPVASIGDQNLLFRQTYTLQASFNGGPFQTRVANAPVAPSRVGPASMPDYARLSHQAVTSLPGGWKTFAGQADDPFFLDLRVFDLLYGTNLKEVGQDTLAGYNVNTIAIQVPVRDVALNENAKRNPVIGIWSTADRPRVRIAGQASRSAKNWVQVSRLGNPLVNEVVVPASLKDWQPSWSPAWARCSGCTRAHRRPPAPPRRRAGSRPGRPPPTSSLRASPARSSTSARFPGTMTPGLRSAPHTSSAPALPPIPRITRRPRGRCAAHSNCGPGGIRPPWSHSGRSPTPATSSPPPGILPIVFFAWIPTRPTRTASWLTRRPSSVIPRQRPKPSSTCSTSVLASLLRPRLLRPRTAGSAERRGGADAASSQTR
jgi:hypothetical protein